MEGTHLRFPRVGARRLSLVRFAASLLLGGLAAAWNGPALAGPIASRPVYTNKARFRIPYRSDAEEMRGLGAREIRLYISENQGQTWSHAQTVAPETGRFQFEARRDGEYWFAVKTLDGQNRLHPDGDLMEAGLRVVVDTVAPRLELALQQVTPGRVRLLWSGQDERLDPTRLKLEYLQAPETRWQPVTIVPRPSGQTEWSVPHGGTVAVRGLIADLAQNMAEAQAQVTVEGAAAGVPKPAAPDFKEPIAGPRSSTGGLALQMPEAYPTPIPDNGSARDPQPGSRIPAAAISRTTTQDERSPAEPAETAPRDAARPSNARFVASRQFQIAYRIHDVGPSGLGAVMLYLTQDGGATWMKYGDDSDLQSPFHVHVNEEGTYGFVLHVQSGAGLASDPPQPGDKPQIVVVVDQTPPRAELLPIEQGRGAAVNKVLIQWSVTDLMLAENPVALSFASSRQGPWQPISGWQPNSGRYVWTVGPSAPSRIYLRLEARDAAGNLQRIDSPQPILVDLSRPTARILDVETGMPLAPE